MRRVRMPDVRATDVRENGIVGTLFEPPGDPPHPTVLVLGGSEGGLPETTAAVLAGRGFATLALAYFGVEGLPAQLGEIPLEYFDHAIAWLRDRPGTGGRRIAVVGTSKGGEAALLVASHNRAIAGVVAYVPSHVVWTGIGTQLSSWTRNNERLPCVRFKPVPGMRTPGQPMKVGLGYVNGLDDAGAERAARIPVEDIDGPILLLSGRDDQLWPSAMMCDRITAHLTESGFEHPVVHLAFDDVGHGIPRDLAPTAGVRDGGGGRFLLGGQPAATARAFRDSWPRVISFLEMALVDKR
jgi:dienelactone hydrolase